MAITTRDGLVSAVAASPRIKFYKPSVTTVAAVFHSLFRSAGNPGSGAAIGASGTSAAFTRSSAGALGIQAPSGTSYVGGLSAQCSTTGTLLIADRIGEYIADANAASTSLGALSLPTRATSLADIEAWFEIGVALGATPPGTITLTYTNQASTGGRSATIATGTVPGSAIVGRTVPFTLQAGDTGVLSAQTVAHTATATVGARGIVVLRRVLAEIPLVAVGIGANLGWPETDLERVGDDACLELIFLPTGATSGVVLGSISIAQG